VSTTCTIPARRDERIPGAPGFNPATDEVVFSQTDGVYATLTDHLGTVHDLVNQNSVVVNHFVYDAFGNMVGGTAQVHWRNRIGFAGAFFEAATGLQYNHHRWYDAAAGRWISEDPIGFDGGDSNLNRYVGNQVTTATDPSGLVHPGLVALGFGMAWVFGTPRNAHAPCDDFDAGRTGTLDLQQQQANVDFTIDLFSGMRGGARKSAIDDADRFGLARPRNAKPSSATHRAQRAQNAARPAVNTSLPSRVTKELPAGQLRTPDEVKQARNFFERNKDAAKKYYTDRTGKQWPKEATHCEHPRAIKDGGDPLFVEPGFGGPNARHQIPRTEYGGLTDAQRWGKLGGRPKK
jgi:RHS repeat-associated protein